MAPSRGRSDSPDLERLAHLIHVPLFSHQTWIYGEWIPRKSNWSGLISRLGDVDPWSAGMGCLVYTSAWWQWGAPALATGAQQSKHEEKVMPQVTSRTIKKEFKSSQKNKKKEGRLPQGAAPVPFETGEVFKQPATILPALPDFGGRTFGCSADTAGQNEAFWNRYGQYVHQPSIGWPSLAPFHGPGNSQSC